MKNKLKILPTSLLIEYQLSIKLSELKFKFDNLIDADISTDSFNFYSSVASVYSSKIEGENIKLDSYIKHKKYAVEFKPNYTKKIDDLYNAYSFAQNNVLNKSNIEIAHKLLTKNILSEQLQGEIRRQNMYVFTSEGKIEYVAATMYEVHEEIEKFYDDLHILISEKLTIEEVFFFASMIHLIFVKIHPFNDGNGRTARLLEKWFLAQKLGEKAWFVQSEKFYYNQHQIYYNNLRTIGLEYIELDFSKALPFLLMLTNSIV
jgi:Fic family protein